MIAAGRALRLTFRSFVTLALLVAAACAAVPPPGPVGAQDVAVQIRSSALPLRLDEPSERRVGRLIWRGGIAMTANSRNFGGWSDLDVSTDGRTLTTISDEGAWLTAIIDYDDKSNLAGLSAGRIGSLRGLDGQPLADKVMADAESMARLPDGSWLIAFERRHRFWRYSTIDATPVPFEGPVELPRQPANGGVEALAALADGRIVAISEELLDKPGSLMGWIGTPAEGGRYTWSTFSYAKTASFKPTALTQLPDGSLATLERHFDGVNVHCRVMRFPLAELKTGATVAATELARLSSSSYLIDNMEGLSATKGPRGETLLWLISDDNFNPLQRNILLLFELAP